MLTLPIKKKWFDMILSGEKKEEYRNITSYYNSRFSKYLIGEPFEVLFRNGYSKNSPTIKCKVFRDIDMGNPKWGAHPGIGYHVLKILSVEEVK